MAISTDYNPGSCPQQSLAQVMTWAALRYRMSSAECLTAATLNPACSLGRGHEIGTLEPGKRADLVIFSCANLRRLVAEFASPPCKQSCAAFNDSCARSKFTRSAYRH